MIKNKKVNTGILNTYSSIIEIFDIIKTDFYLDIDSDSGKYFLKN